jgi:putative nucleotidyltransferase with HDIG domain
LSSEETAKKRILMVDDDRSVLDGLRRLLHRKAAHWKIEFVTSGRDALAAMRITHYDIIVSDLRMTGMNGVELLEKVRKKYPDTIRFILSGYNDKPLIDKAVRCVHQFVAKPCNAEVLAEMIEQAFTLRSRLRSEKVKAALSNLRSLPVMPAVYQRAIEMLQNPDVSSRRVGKLIALDIGMTAKILQVVNSAFYGLRSRIIDPVHAVVYLGLKTVEGLLLTEGVFSKLDYQTIERFGVRGLQDHCIRVGALARKICNSENMTEEDIDVANMAGILHDTGKIILISRFPDEFEEAIKISRQTGRLLVDVEREIIGVTHGELGGCLLELWGLPNVMIESTTYHHEPAMHVNDQFSVLTAVHIADALDHQLCSSFADALHNGINMDYMEKLDVVHKVDKWRKIYLPAMQPEHEYAAEK